MSAGDRLLPAQGKVHERLYDAESMMHTDGSVARGFVVLLNGGAPSESPTATSPPEVGTKKKSKLEKKEQQEGAAGGAVEDGGGGGDDDGNSLAFMALTCGNVLDACFGVTNPSARRTGEDSSTPARRNAQAAKDLLDECATTASFRRTAVAAYRDAFGAIALHDEQVRKLNCFTRCFRARKVRRDTEDRLHAAFASLVQAVEESSSSTAR
jgi:hypothetical protein